MYRHLLHKWRYLLFLKALLAIITAAIFSIIAKQIEIFIFLCYNIIYKILIL